MFLDRDHISYTNGYADSVSDICWTPTERDEVLVNSSWDGFLRGVSFDKYEKKGKEAFSFDLQQPVLACCCNPNSPEIYAGLLNGDIKAIDLKKQRVSHIGNFGV